MGKEVINSEYKNRLVVGKKCRRGHSIYHEFEGATEESYPYFCFDCDDNFFEIDVINDDLINNSEVYIKKSRKKGANKIIFHASFTNPSGATLTEILKAFHKFRECK